MQLAEIKVPLDPFGRSGDSKAISPVLADHIVQAINQNPQKASSTCLGLSFAHRRQMMNALCNLLPSADVILLANGASTNSKLPLTRLSEYLFSSQLVHAQS
jgi:hypothetical protein